MDTKLVSPAAIDRARPRLAAHGLVAAPGLMMMVCSAMIAILIRAPFLSWPLTVDEAGYAYGARWWFDGLALYSDDLWFDRPQGIFLVYRVGSLILGESVEAMRLHGAIWAAVTAVLVLLIARRLFDRRVAYLAGPLFAVASAAPAIEGFTANAEVFMVAAVTASAYLVWDRRWFAAGLLAACAILLKPSGVSAALLLAFWLIQHRESRRAWLLALSGGALPLLVAVAHGVITAGAGAYFYAVVWFRLTAGGDSNPFLALIAGWYWTAPVWLVLGILSYPARTALRTASKSRTFLAAWLVSSVLGMAIGSNWFLHYFQQLIPPLAILAALGVTSITQRGQSVGRATAVSAGVVAALALLLIAPSAAADPDDGAESIFGSSGYRRNEEIGRYIEAITDPDDLVFVGLSHASILYRTNRRSSSGYLYSQQLVEIPGALDSAVEQLEGGVPAVVVLLRYQLEPLDTESRILGVVSHRYEFDRRFDRIELWTRRGDP